MSLFKSEHPHNIGSSGGGEQECAKNELSGAFGESRWSSRTYAWAGRAATGPTGRPIHPKLSRTGEDEPLQEEPEYYLLCLKVSWDTNVFGDTHCTCSVPHFSQCLLRFENITKANIVNEMPKLCMTPIDKNKYNVFKTVFTKTHNFLQWLQSLCCFN